MNSNCIKKIKVGDELLVEVDHGTTTNKVKVLLITKYTYPGTFRSDTILIADFFNNNSGISKESILCDYPEAANSEVVLAANTIGLINISHAYPFWKVIKVYRK